MKGTVGLVMDTVHIHFRDCTCICRIYNASTWGTYEYWTILLL